MNGASVHTPKSPSPSGEGCKGGVVPKGLDALEALRLSELPRVFWRADARTHPYTPPLKGRGRVR
jgi:hypothetical protein